MSFEKELTQELHANVDDLVLQSVTNVYTKVLKVQYIIGMCVCIYMHVCVCVRLCMCMHASVQCLCVWISPSRLPPSFGDLARRCSTET